MIGLDQGLTFEELRDRQQTAMNTYLFQYEYQNEQFRFEIRAVSEEEAVQRVSRLSIKAHLIPGNLAETSTLGFWRMMYLRYWKNHRFYNLGPLE